MGSERTQMMNGHCRSSASNKQSERDANHSLEWLPHDWITEVRTRKNGTKEGAKYKCYIDPSTGKTFYSKPEVERYLRGRQQTNRWSEQKMKGGSASTSTNVCFMGSDHPPEAQKSDPRKKESQFQKSHQQKSNSTKSSMHMEKSEKFDPVTNEVQHQTQGNISSSEVIVEKCTDEGLPPGWIKEIRIKRSSGKVRKDPFYVDSASGYVFRSRVEVLRYLDSGERSRHVFKRKNSITIDSNLINDEASPLPSVKRSKLAVSSTRDGSPEISPPSRSKLCADPLSEAGSEPMKDGTGEGKRRISQNLEKSSLKRRNGDVSPHRSSNRFLGIKDDPRTQTKENERVLRSSLDKPGLQEKATPDSRILPSKDQNVDDDPCLNEESDFCFSSAIWTDDDPCLDSAIKTLTGAIPFADMGHDQLCSPSEQNKKDAILLDINEPPGPSSALNIVSPLVIPGLLSLQVNSVEYAGSCSSRQNESTIDRTTLDSGTLLEPSQKIGPSELDVSDPKHSELRCKTRRKRKR